jgi:hypothetical protein
MLRGTSTMNVNCRTNILFVPIEQGCSIYKGVTDVQGDATMNENCRTNILFVPIEQGCSIYTREMAYA